MTFADEFLGFMPHRLGVEPYLTRDAWGKKFYGPKITYWGRVVNKRRQVIDRAGQMAVSETTIYMVTASGVGIEDRITLPSGCVPAWPTIITVARIPDEYGGCYTAVYA